MALARNVRPVIAAEALITGGWEARQPCRAATFPRGAYAASMDTRPSRTQKCHAVGLAQVERDVLEDLAVSERVTDVLCDDLRYLYLSPYGDFFSRSRQAAGYAVPEPATAGRASRATSPWEHVGDVVRFRRGCFILDGPPMHPILSRL